MARRLTRRGFLRTAAMASSVCLFARPAGARTEGKTAQPDILLIMPDQMRGDCLSVLGHPAVNTPTLDTLARQGTLFRRAYSSVPSCIPARYAMLTGLHPQTSGVVGFKNKPITTRTFPQILTQAGYATVLVGRNMHQVPSKEDYGGTLNGYQKAVLGSTYVDNDEYDVFLRRNAPESGGIRNLVRKLGISYNTSSAAPWPLAEDLHPTAWVVAESRRALAEAPSGLPLFLTSSFYAPHPPLFPPQRFIDVYRQKELPPAAHGDWVAWNTLSPKGDKTGSRILLAGDALRRDQAGYFGLIEQLDAAIAPLIAEFRARSEKAGRPWLIVVTADHGEMLGDHGYFRKCEPYEGSASIPFIIAGSPETGFRPGQYCKQPVGLEDIMPTLLAAAGEENPDRIDGINLTPVLKGSTATLRECFHFEHAPCYSTAQAFHALADGSFKYIWRPLEGTEQLFDLDSDPREEHDLARDASARPALEKWRAIMIQRLRARPEGFSDGRRLIPGRPYPPLMAGSHTE